MLTIAPSFFIDRYVAVGTDNCPNANTAQSGGPIAGSRFPRTSHRASSETTNDIDVGDG